MKQGSILVTGGAGRLARSLQMAAPHRVTTVARTSCDVTDPSAIARTLAEKRPSLVINAAVFNGIELNEREPERAHAVNAIAPGNLAHACARAAIPLIHISTDYVFGAEATRPWRESDPTSPVNTYGHVKAEGEQRVLATHPGASVVRVAWLFGDGACFLSQAVRTAVQSGVMPATNEQVGSPTPIPSLAAHLIGLADRMVARDRRSEGLLHLAGGPPVSRRNWIESALGSLQVPRRRDADISTERPSSTQIVSAPRRPEFSALDCARAEALFGWRLEWEASSQAYVRQLVREICSLGDGERDL